jgi:hypothetical protein
MMVLGGLYLMTLFEAWEKTQISQRRLMANSTWTTEFFEIQTTLCFLK